MLFSNPKISHSVGGLPVPLWECGQHSPESSVYRSFPRHQGPRFRDLPLSKCGLTDLVLEIIKVERVAWPVYFF